MAVFDVTIAANLWKGDVTYGRQVDLTAADGAKRCFDGFCGKIGVNQGFDFGACKRNHDGVSEMFGALSRRGRMVE